MIGRALLVASLFMLGCRPPAEPDADAEVRALLDKQAHDWNAGDLEGFMGGYWRSDQTRFNSGGEIAIGWQTVLDRYRRRYADHAAMGRLQFSEIRVTPLPPGAALATGRWQLQRAEDAPSGLFTLLLRRMPEGWRIVHDHTSTAEKR